MMLFSILEFFKAAAWGLHLPPAHGYAGDTQLYFSLRPMSLESQFEAINVLESCIAEVRSWFKSNRLMINDIKTEFLIIRSRHKLAKTTIDYRR